MEFKSLGLEAILDWKMTQDEGDVFHISLVYEQEFRKLFGSEIDGQDFRRNMLPRKGDPRKSNLFRQCWKLRRETRGLIEKSEYRHYVHANLFIIKANSGHIEPNVITGDKAWIRYKVWKRLYDKKMAEVSAQAPPPSISTTDPKLIAEIDRTKKFLFEKCEGNVTFDKIRNFTETGILKLWVATNKVSPYYVVLSPWVNKCCDLKSLFSVCNASMDFYKERTTQQVRDYFAHEYKHEFN